MMMRPCHYALSLWGGVLFALLLLLLAHAALSSGGRGAASVGARPLGAPFGGAE